MSDGPFLCYRELLPSTAINHAVFFHSYNYVSSNYEENLLLLTCSSISIYAIKKRETLCKNNMELLMSDRLFGKPQDVCVYYYQNYFQKEECIIVIAIDFGKLLILRYDSVENVLKTLFMSNADTNSIGFGSDMHAQTHGKQFQLGLGLETVIKVDHINGLCCSVIYGLQLYIILLPKEDSLITDSIDTYFQKYFHSEAENQFLLDVQASLNLTGPILDICFISGYSQPAVAILQESRIVPMGHVGSVRNTCTVTVVAIDTAKKSAFVLWKQSKLPHDSIKLVQLSARSLEGSLCLITLSAILIVSQEKVYGIATNGFAAVTVSNHIQLQTWEDQKEGLELDGSHWLEDISSSFESHNLVGVLKDGNILKIGLLYSTESSLENNSYVNTNVFFHPSLVVKSVPASCFCSSLMGDFWFLGSVQTECLLFKVDRTAQISNAEQKNQLSFLKSSLDSNKKLNKNSDVNEENKEELLLYGAPIQISEIVGSNVSTTKNENNITRSFQLYWTKQIAYDLVVCGSIAVLGPVLHGAFSRSDDIFAQYSSINWERKANNNNSTSFNTAASYIAERELKDTFQISSGLDDSGSLYRIFSGLQLSKLATRNFSDAAAILSIIIKTSLNVSNDCYTILFVIYKSKTRILHCGEQLNRKRVNELKVKELLGSDSGFITTEATLAIGFVDIKKLTAVQIFRNGVRLVKLAENYGVESEALQDVLLADNVEVGGLSCRANEYILAGNVNADYIVLLTNLHGFFIIQYENEFESLSLKFRVLNPSSFVYIPSSKNIDEEMVMEENGIGGVQSEKIAVVEDDEYWDSILNSNNEQLKKSFTSSIVSVSLFHGLFVPYVQKQSVKSTSVVSNKNAANEESKQQASIAEEIYLYGLELSSLNIIEENTSDRSTQQQVPHRFSNIIDKRIKNIIDSEKALNRSISHLIENESYLIVNEADGFLSIIRLKDMTCLLRSDGFAKLDPLVLINGGADEKKSNQKHRLIVESKLVRLSQEPSDSMPSVDTNDSNRNSKLCLVVMFHNYDVAVYVAKETESGEICSFFKVHHHCVSNRKQINIRRYQFEVTDPPSPKNSLKRDSSTLLNDAESSESKAIIKDYDYNLVYTTYIESKEYLKQMAVKLNYFDNLGNRSGVLVHGNNPILISNHHGLPQIINIAFPEIPFINYGQCSVVPLQLKTVNGLATLWIEFEDRDSTVTGTTLVSKALNPLYATKPALLGIYQEVDGVGIFPNSTIGLKRLSVGKTVHRLEELVKAKTDDKTEQILLEKKTFVMSCSEEIESEFLPMVVENEEKDMEDILFERYFTKLESFAQPDLKVGKAPTFKDRKHSLVIMQNGVAIDVFDLPALERVVDIEVVYLPIEKQIPQAQQNILAAANFMLSLQGQVVKKAPEKRAFIIAGTTILDKRGEDTQGTGRLLLFGLDYSLFQEDEITAVELDTADTKKDEQSGSIEKKLFVDMDIDGTEKENSGTSSLLNNANEDESLKAQQVNNKMDIEMESKLIDTNGSSSSSIVKNTNIASIEEKETVKTTTVPMTNSNVVSTATTDQAKFLGAIQPKLRLLWSGAGPSSVIKQLGEQYILSTVGSIIYIYKLNSDTLELEQVCFYFSQFYITSVSIIKNYILIADMLHSISFLVWRERDLSLNFLAKDYDKSVVLSTAFIYDNAKLGIIVGDNEGNIQLMQENPKKLESIKGSRLLCLADFHLGSDATLLMSHESLSTEAIKKIPPRDPLDSRPPPPPPKRRRDSNFPLQAFSTRFNKSSTNIAKSSCTIVGTVDGSIGVLVPIEEKMYRRLAVLQQIMIFTVKTPLALNPREYRLFKSTRFRFQKRKGVLDGCILWLFFTLHPTIQAELADVLGVSAYTIKENLREIECYSTFF